MGVRFPSVFSTAVLGVLPANGAETIICTTPPLMQSLDFAPVFVFWWFQGNAGAGTTALTTRIRRGVDLTGVVLTTDVPVAVTAASLVSLSGCLPDRAGAGGGLQYSFSLTGTGTTGVGTAVDMVMLAFSL